jgi:hypothetical protein
VVEKHNFFSIQQKILQISDFPKKWDSNPLPHGDIAADIVKIGFLVKKHDFQKNPTGFPQNSPKPVAKISFFPIFANFSAAF